jgi:hypothetical protein
MNIVLTSTLTHDLVDLNTPIKGVTPCVIFKDKKYDG